MEEAIKKELKAIEHYYHVKIIYACESGSRAWGFPSVDSDYDVRFIYFHKPEHYLSIDPIGIGKNRDVIEVPINKDLDISGWDFTKAAKLLRKSNPPLLEWLQSDIVYYEYSSVAAQLRHIKSEMVSPKSCIHHYLNMANNNYREYLQGEVVRIKKYFYVLRPILAATWMMRYNSFPPLSFQTLVTQLIPKGKLRQQINQLLERKMSGMELDLEKRISVFHTYFDEAFEELEEYANSVDEKKVDSTEKLNCMFRSALKEVWN